MSSARLAIVVVLAASVTFTTLLAGRAFSADQAPPPPTPTPTAPAIDAYVQGLLSFNAELIWSSMGEQLRADANERGRGLRYLEGDFRRQEQQGRRYESVLRVGSAPLRAGGRVYFLLVTLRDRPDLESREQTFVLTTDASGKIVRIE